VKILTTVLICLIIIIAGCGVSSNDSEMNTSYYYDSTIGADFVLVPAGTFMMGSDSGSLNERPLHQVTISKPFYIQTTEVTQEQWWTVMGFNSAYFRDCGRNCPAENMSWWDLQEFLRRLNEREGRNKYRLPTEAEWEYAAKNAGKDNYLFSGGDDIFEVAWFLNNSDWKTHPVGLKKANGLGVYDMSGNVEEWCSDWYGPYPSGSVIDPQGPSTGSFHVTRGGDWTLSPVKIVERSPNPINRSEEMGFRLVCTVR
jgi:formylglycine-generating enzyme required for sulfatase activity